ncbi:hypothetical protein H6G76_36370 [Nostoc sp. FACHB-152]|nr:hypothetical protein [Nostoc sp. FACHB-145]MBD2452476.1 hypothetical protein [Nostoc sp. FACHB-152]MBD2470367.1 hypothetical protein [Nostoc sp. FACHB-145]
MHQKEEIVGRFPRLEATGEPEGFNQVEIELSVLSCQCLERRIADVQKLSQEIACWQSERNSRKESVNWRFKTTDARKKMGRLYPSILPSKVESLINIKQEPEVIFPLLLYFPLPK